MIAQLDIFAVGSINGKLILEMFNDLRRRFTIPDAVTGQDDKFYILV